ncbi:MAG: T9SS type A sorting domain-containing protein [Ignavibacteria bacterium]|jgi:hypothetical protein
MKLLFNAVSIAIIAILLVAPSRGNAQEVIPVSHLPIGNLNEFIMGDTTETGERAHPDCIYELKRDSVYFYTGTMEIDFPLTIVAEDGDGVLPVIEPAILTDGSKPTNFINLTGGGLTLKNLYLFALGPDESRTNYCVLITGTDMKIVADSCVFDSWYGAFRDNSGSNGYRLTNNKFRNAQSPTSWFWGTVLAVRGSTTPSDTIYIENNTIFCNNRGFEIPYYNKRLVFNHNTVFLNAVTPLTIHNCVNGEITNNIFYGMEAEAQRQVEIDGGWFENDGECAAVVSFDTLTTVTSDFGITESDRNIKINNNAYYWPQAIKDKWQSINDTASTNADSVYLPVWMNDRTLGMLADKTTWPNIEATNNLNVDPGFDSDMEAACLEKLVYYVDLTRSGGLATYLWYYDPAGARYPITQPIPEDLAYSNAALQNAGTDGYALGDLNWFPDQKAEFDDLTSVEELNEVLPVVYQLSQNYPNPFNPTTNIKFSIPEYGNFKLKVFNILGEVVAELHNGILNAGQYKVTFDAAKLVSGVYFYSLQGKNVNITRKMMLIK